MKITSSKRDDILKRKAEYEADFNERKARYDEQESAFYKAEHDITSRVEENVMSQLSRFSKLEFRVTARRGRWGAGGLEVNIQCNENNKFSDDVALAWNYTANLDKNGNVTKESSSWSGLKATTAAQLESLEQTLEALKYLNSVDWAVVLDQKMPEYRDYITERNPSWDRDKPDWDAELLEADLEECIGIDALVEGVAGESSGYRRGLDMYYIILKETPTQYVITEGLKDYIDGIIAEKGLSEGIAYVKDSYSYRLRKDNFHNLLKKPLNIVK